MNAAGRSEVSWWDASGGAHGPIKNPSPQEVPSLWDVVVGVEATSIEALQLADAYRGDASMRGAMHLAALVRLRTELSRIPADAESEDPVVIRATDAVLLTRVLLKTLA